MIDTKLFICMLLCSVILCLCNKHDRIDYFVFVTRIATFYKSSDINGAVIYNLYVGVVQVKTVP